MIVTANRRIARTLKSKEQFIRTWDGFIDFIFEKKFPEIKIASAIEYHWAWKQALRDSHLSLGIAGDKTLQALEEAYELVQLQGVDLEQLANYKADTDFFVQAAVEFETILKKRGKIASCEKLKRLCQSQDLTKCLNCKEIHFYGFISFSALQKKLIQLIQAEGVSIHFDEVKDKNSSIKKIKFESMEAEFESVLKFTRQAADSGKRIGIIVPHLEKSRNLIERKLSQIFDPQSILPAAACGEQAYRISLGNPLISYASISFLINSLAIFHLNPLFSQWSTLLRSPFILGFYEEIAERSLFEIELRKLNQKYISFEDFLSLDKMPALFREQCEKMYLQMKSIEKNRTLTDWNIFIKQWMNDWGWPGQSNDPEMIDFLNKTMEAYESSGDLYDAISFSEFYAFFNKTLAKTLYQPSEKETSVEVMGFLEAIGLEFDIVWLLGMTDLVYPPAPMPNPFIPIQIQIAYDFPRSHAKRESHICGKIFKKIVEASSQVFVSYCQYDEQGELVSESPLIAPIELINFSEIFIQKAKHFYEIFQGTPVEAPENKMQGVAWTHKNVKGGVSVLKDQIACPFKSYLRHRLGVQSLEFPQIGLNSKTKGILIHEILEILFKKVESQSDLINISEWDIKNAIERVLLDKAKMLGDFEKDIELNRLYRLIEKFILLEQDRESFKIIGLEQKVKWNYQGHCFSFKIDRIDETEQGQYFLIDYKTGTCELKNLSLEVMDDPQLPLYAISMSQNPGAVGYFSLKRDDFKFKRVGLVNAPGIEKYALDDWTQFLSQWREKIEETAHAFLTGHSAMNPKYGENTCKKCDFYSGCPIRGLND